MVTLRKRAHVRVLDRLVNVALPRIRDFQGHFAEGLRRARQLRLGIKEQIIFPEIDYDKIDKVKGMNIAIVTTARTDEEGRASAEAHGDAVPELGNKTEESMAKKSLIAKAKRTPKFSVRHHNRCPICGRPRGVLPQVRHVQDLSSQARAPGRDPRRHQVELVDWEEQGFMGMTDPIADMLTRIRNANRMTVPERDMPALEGEARDRRRS